MIKLPSTFFSPNRTFQSSLPHRSLSPICKCNRTLIFVDPATHTIEVIGITFWALFLMSLQLIPMTSLYFHKLQNTIYKKKPITFLLSSSLSHTPVTFSHSLLWVRHVHIIHTYKCENTHFLFFYTQTKNGYPNSLI